MTDRYDNVTLAVIGLLTLGPQTPGSLASQLLLGGEAEVKAALDRLASDQRVVRLPDSELWALVVR
jgi:hypothetical protein